MHPTIFCKAGDKYRHRVQKAIPGFPAGTHTLCGKAITAMPHDWCDNKEITKNLGESDGMKLPECPRCTDIYSGE